MKAKKHIVGFRVDDTELEKINNQVTREHLGYVSTLVRKATFWYIEFMNKPELEAQPRITLNEDEGQKTRRPPANPDGS